MISTKKDLKGLEEALKKLLSHIERHRKELKLNEEVYQLLLNRLHDMLKTLDQVELKDLANLADIIMRGEPRTRQLDEDYLNENVGLTYQQAFTKLCLSDLTEAQAGRLLYMASWIQVNGWSPLDESEALHLASQYYEVGIDPLNINFVDR